MGCRAMYHHEGSQRSLIPKSVSSRTGATGGKCHKIDGGQCNRKKFTLVIDTH